MSRFSVWLADVERVMVSTWQHKLRCVIWEFDEILHTISERVEPEVWLEMRSTQVNALTFYNMTSNCSAKQKEVTSLHFLVVLYSFV